MSHESVSTMTLLNRMQKNKDAADTILDHIRGLAKRRGIPTDPDPDSIYDDLDEIDRILQGDGEWQANKGGA